MRMYDIIEKKKYGKCLSYEEIEYAVMGYVKGEIPDYQMSAFLMAIYFQGMDKREIVDLTMIMAHSGDMVDLSLIEGVKVDKHSTGGVGDKTSLVLAPLIASVGIPMAKMSGRGLGHTGGTIDKLESFKGFSTAVSKEAFISNVNKIKVAIAGQTGNLAPADKKIYALRDVTATVDCIPLIASSIMSKKLAAGADVIVLDVKVGSGAFMTNIDDAVELARTMVDIGNGAGRKTIAVISDMDKPLGDAVGNSLEVIEAIETLKCKGPDDLTELCLVLGTQILLGAGVYNTEKEARNVLEEKLRDGSALNKFKEWISMQGGDELAVSDYSRLPKASIVYEYKSKEEGYIFSMDAKEVGKACLVLGGGRETKESEIDLSVGVILNKKTADKVSVGDTLCTIYASDEKKLHEAVKVMDAVYKFTQSEVAAEPLVKSIIS